MRKIIVAAVAVGLLILAAGAGAASRWVITSTHQIKPSVLKHLRGPAGPPGLPGPRGAPGASGSGGANGANGGSAALALVTVDSPKLTLQPGQTTYDVMPIGFQANCPAGYSATGTGFDADAVATPGFLLSYGSFVGGFFANNSSISATVYIQAMCAAGGSSGANAVHRSDPGAAYQADLARAAAVR